jgi:hypothetical protein
MRNFIVVVRALTLYCVGVNEPYVERFIHSFTSGSTAIFWAPDPFFSFFFLLASSDRTTSSTDGEEM